MDSDTKDRKKNKFSINSIGSRDIFQPLRIRRDFCPNSELDEFLLDYLLNFLPNVGIMLWCLLLLC